MQLKFPIALIFSFFFLASTASNAEVIAIKAGKLVDVDNGKVLSEQVIIIEDGKVKEIGQGLQIPKQARSIDLSKQTVLPGLIDCHTHLIGSPTEMDPISEAKKTGAQKAFDSIPNARQTLEAGFTTVRDMGTYRALVDVALRDAINKGDIPGPRMFASGAYITITKGGGALTGFAPDITIPLELRFGEADDPWTVRRRIRELAHYGVDQIKVIASGAVLTHGSNPNAEEFTPEEMQAAVDEAGKFGLKVAAHAHSARAIKDAVKAGVASIEHGTFLDDEGIELMKQHGTYLVADIYDDDFILGEGKDKGMPKDFVEHESDLGRIQRENFQKAVKAGVKIAFGTDAGVFPHGWNAKQFPYMVKYGLSPMQAIQSSTIWAADLIGKSSSFGSIKPGKFADLIAVDGDPLTDIKRLEKVTFVMKEGKIYKQAL